MNGRKRGRWWAGRARGVVLVAVAAVVAPLAAAAPAGAADGGSGTVVQTGPPQTLVNGSPAPAELRFTATLPAGTTGDVTARLLISSLQFPGGGWDDPWRVSARLGATCAAGDAPLVPCEWRVPDDSVPGVEDADNVILDLPVTAAAPTVTYAVDMTVDSNFWREDQPITGSLRVKSATDGSVLATGPFQVQYHYVTPLTDLTAMYGRDSAGVLWKYEGTGDRARPFEPRRRVGPGWQIYTAITPLGEDSAGGTGDVVARDKDGVLWYYRGTGDRDQPFARRIRVGSGWNIYTALMAGGWSSSSPVGRTLVARDASGRLWQYAATGDMSRPFTARIQIGHGWNIYRPVTGYCLGIIGRDSSGVLWAYDRLDNGYRPRVRVGGGWQVYTALAGIKDASGDTTPDLVARDAAGKLWLYTSTHSYPPRPGTKSLVGGGWNIYNLIF